ncbi:MAG: UDP-N-acetylenolpyruvoylglucosamine reductase, partial [Chloroflexota bacterium]|nr:UDP-N-acetylenolpyruvoylglucosamine reductase [Chloroflexota bacterium]
KGIVVLDNTGNVSERNSVWLDARYRHTRIKVAPRPRNEVVLAVILALPKGDPAQLNALAEDHARFRKETQPTGACSGSTFANPPGDFAGRLLEAVELKGYQHGQVQFSAKHSNWIVNTGGGTAAQARELMALAYERVRDRLGVELRPEVEQVGEF